MTKDLSQLMYSVRKRSFTLHIQRILADIFPGIVVRQRTGTFGCITKVHQHDQLDILRKSQCLCHLRGIKAIQPAAIDTLIGGCQDHMGGHNGGILCTGGMNTIGIGVNVRLIVAYCQHGRRTIAAGSNSIHLSQRFLRLQYADALLLKILSGGSQTTGCQNGIDLFLFYLSITIFFAGITLLDDFIEFHNDLLS